MAGYHEEIVVGVSVHLARSRVDGAMKLSSQTRTPRKFLSLVVDFVVLFRNLSVARLSL
jgi:hypothetical protein